MIPVAELKTAEDVRAHARRVKEATRRREGEALRARAAELHAPTPKAETVDINDLNITQAIDIVIKRDAMSRAVAMATAIVSSTKPYPPLDFILGCVSQAFNVPVSEIASSRRNAVLHPPRRAYSWLAKQITGKSFPEIARGLGGKDHTTILHAVRMAEETRARDDEFRRVTDHLRHSIPSAWERFIEECRGVQ